MILKPGEVYFNNRMSLDLNLRLENHPIISTVNEEYEEIKVEGRNGSLYENKGTFPDREVPLTFTLVSKELALDFDEIMEWLTYIEDNRLMYNRIDKTLRVKKILTDNLSPEFVSFGEIPITFICEPFLTDLEPTIYTITSNNFSFEYYGNASADSLIKVYGSGNIQLTINGETMQINSVSSYFEIDSDLLQVRNADGTSKDGDTIGDFVMFEKGINTIAYTGSVTKIVVEYTTKYKW